MRLPRFRIFTWIILTINVLFLIWLIVGVADRPTTATGGCGSLDVAACQAASDVGTGIGALLVVFLWVAADVILGILWLVTRRKTRDCPACGRSVKRGKMECGSCGFDFAKAANSPQII